MQLNIFDMSDKEQSTLISKIVLTLVISLLVGTSSPWWWSDVKEFFNPSPEKPEIEIVQPTEVEQPIEVEPTTTPKCSAPWEWDADLQSCVRKVTVSPKTLSIKLNSAISSVAGRIDFYTNTERLPGVNANNQAMYKANKGALQVVIPIMKGNINVGTLYEVIYSTKEGTICKVSSLPETTAWLKKMRVAYSLRLESDCNKVDSFCQTELSDSGKRVHITTKKLVVTIAKNCN